MRTSIKNQLALLAPKRETEPSSSQVYELTRNLAASRAQFVASALFKNTVSIWDLTVGTQVAKFDTIMDAGGLRLALGNGGAICIAGAYYDEGVAAYDSATGRLLWQQKEVSRVQRLSLSHDDDRVYVACQHRPCLILDLETGQELTRLDGVNSIFESEYERVRLVDDGNLKLQWENLDRNLKIVGPHNNVYRAVFGPGFVFIADLGRTVSLFNTASGVEQWQYTPPGESYVIHFGYSRHSRSFWAVQTSHANRSAGTILHFDANGNVEREFIIELGVTLESVQFGDKLITSKGHVFDIATGQLDAKLPFP